jgi:hypothetical protein
MLASVRGEMYPHLKTHIIVFLLKLCRERYINTTSFIEHACLFLKECSKATLQNRSQANKLFKVCFAELDPETAIEFQNIDSALWI